MRHAEIFAAVNCGALVDNLLESELFGHKKGAFTGANRDHEGLFEVAHAGTLFLDEVGEMTPALQVKLLRVLEVCEITPVGGTQSRKVDVRVICATNKDLQQAVREGAFREDLFYRLHVFPVQVPPLAQRREDIPALARHFLVGFADATGSPVTDFSDEALRVLCSGDYPGNVRQLANEIQRAVLMAGDAEIITPEHLGADDTSARAAQAAGRGSLKEQMANVEKVLIEEALNHCDQNRTRAAKRLGITRQALLVKLNKYGMGKSS
jgi:transcriptional regulator with PAS, ATPase and Fis domain